MTRQRSHPQPPGQPRNRPDAPGGSGPSGGRRQSARFLLLAITAGVVLAVVMQRRQAPPAPGPTEPAYVPRPKGEVTFNRDIAPILFAECAPCHRPGETAPFALLSYEDARKRGRQIVQVTGDRYMPPFLPEPGIIPFADARRLTVTQLGLLQQWVADGMPEGAPGELPARPQWTDGWQLGPPELVVRMPEAFPLPADGPDIYRNFVIPVPLGERRHVRAVEFRPGTRAIHHVFIQVDRTRNSRKRDAQDAVIGFSGMESPVTVESPSGHFVGWQPGRGPTRMPPGLPWTIEPGTDLVLQIHLQPSGRPEQVQPSIGFHFTDQGPTNTPFKIALSSYAIDIPAGAAEHAVTDEYVLPVDADLLAVLPHAHYLGKRVEGRATFPDGRVLPLITIPRWDFNWQSDFRYQIPIPLPKGTRLSMRFTYDNSASNPRNPHHPPQRIRYGLQSTDEMGELWLQFLARTPDDYTRAQQDYARRVAEDALTFNRFLLAQDPGNARAHNSLGKALVALGRRDEGLAEFVTAARLKPDFDEALYHLGVMASLANQPAEAERQFVAAIKANPEHYKARNNLGMVYLEQRRFEEARRQFEEVLKLNPQDPNAQANLALLERARAGR